MRKWSMWAILDSEGQLYQVQSVDPDTQESWPGLRAHGYIAIRVLVSEQI